MRVSLDAFDAIKELNVLVERGLKNIYLSMTSFDPGFQVSSKSLIIRAYIVLAMCRISNSPETYLFDFIVNGFMVELKWRSQVFLSLSSALMIFGDTYLRV